MKTKTQAILVGAVFTIIGFLLNPNAPLGGMVWGEAPEGGAEPTGPQVGLLMLVALIESVAFGVGAAFLLSGRKAVARLAPSRGWAAVVTLALTWALMSWVPHSALHQTIGDDFAKLIAIEYLFHVTLVAGAVLIVAFALAAARPAREGSAPAAPARVTVTVAPASRRV